MAQRENARIAVVGCGFYAQNHLHAWSALRDQGAELAAVCDLDHERARASGDEFGVPCRDCHDFSMPVASQSSSGRGKLWKSASDPGSRDTSRFIAAALQGALTAPYPP
ncbi:MAG: hypothetical protein F4Z55_16870 [Boseongicola sp. SB0667_bin_21]|nr:hypothetical protein [Boseongicola sp. SB0667_bin_21]